MKRKKSYAIIVLMLILTACGHNVERSLNENYTPPSVKEQPKMFYPVVAQENSFSGITKVVVIINKDGTVNRTVVIKSSGHDVLDKAVIEYCKELVFNPALKDGQPVESRIVWEVNFNFLDQKWNDYTYNYLQSVDELFSRVKLARNDERLKIEKEILDEHTAFIEKMNDAINFNKIMEKVILPELAEQWKKDWNSWPLSFLLYEDFIERFPDYDSLAAAKNFLKDAVNFDLGYIQKQSVTNPESRMLKENIISKIKQFILNKYPDIVLDGTGANAAVNFKPRS